MYGYIYKITNLINKKIYVGLTTTSIEKRFYTHCHRDKSRNWTSAIDSAIVKYGEKNFVVEQLDTADTQEELNAKEIYWIDGFHSNEASIGYNLSDGGGQPSPQSQCAEANAKRSVSLKKAYAEGRKIKAMQGRHHTLEARRKISEAQIGTHQSEETRRKISQAQKGHANHIQTEDEKRKRTATMKGRTFYHNDALKLCLLVTPHQFSWIEAQGWIKGYDESYVRTTQKKLIQQGVLIRRK